MKWTPKAMIAAAQSINGGRMLEESPVTGNLRIAGANNDVLMVIEHLGGLQKATEFLEVEEIELHNWIDQHYVPTRYVAKIQKRLPRWSRWSLQTPPFDSEASVSAH